MLFNSFEFLFFLPVVFLLYWFVFTRRRWQNLLVVMASYVFYGWWDWRFLLLIIFTSLTSYASGLLLKRYEGHRRRHRAVCAANILVNLGVLGIFKYYDFFVDSLQQLFSAMGYELSWTTLNFILPVGISFYTFQALSYTIDVYRKDVSATHDVMEFLAFINFFPQLVAGPIERASNLLPQFQRDRNFDYARAVDGLRQMLWGFFKKLVIADNCGAAVNMFWGDYQQYSGISLLMLGLLFSVQLYCDFSGYSDIAIGCARLFGITLSQNFNLPYLSRSISEFWRRWHISLTMWFRDYLYFPLGGSRRGSWIRSRNMLIVFAVSGLWHGANWTYVLWGFYHGALLVVYRLLHIKAPKDTVAEGRCWPSLREYAQVSFNMLLVVIGFIMFRAENVSQGWDFISRMILTLGDDFHLALGKRLLIFAIIPLMVMEFIQRDKRHVLEFPDNRWFARRPIRWGIYVALLTAIFTFTFTGNSQQFIYFQF